MTSAIRAGGKEGLCGRYFGPEQWVWAIVVMGLGTINGALMGLGTSNGAGH